MGAGNSFHSSLVSEVVSDPPSHHHHYHHQRLVLLLPGCQSTDKRRGEQVSVAEPCSGCVCRAPARLFKEQQPGMKAAAEPVGELLTQCVSAKSGAPFGRAATFMCRCERW